MVSTRSVLAVGLLVLLAGCGGFLGGGGGGSNGDGSTTAAPTTTTVPDDDGYPDGVSESGDLTDVSALVAAHDEALAGTSYRAELAIEELRDDGQNTSRASRTQTVLVGEDRYRTDLTTRQTARPTFNATSWSNGSVAVRRVTIAGENEQYQQLSAGQFVDQLSGKKTLSDLLALGNYSVERVTKTGDQRYVTLTADEYNGTPDQGEVTAYNSTMVVDGDGRIQEVEIHLETLVDGDTTRVSFAYELQPERSPTVDRPDWVATALDASS